MAISVGKKGQKQQRRNNNEIKYLKNEEWNRLIECIDNYRDKLIVKLLYATGMRVGELSKLKLKDIDFSERFIHIPAENTKTKTARTVVVQKETLSEIRAYLKIAKIKQAPLELRKRKANKRTLTGQGKVFNLSVRRIQQLIKKYSKIANITATPHTLRHTHIVHSLLNHIPIAAVQKQVGHKRLATTQVYSDLAPEQVREAYESH